MSFVYIVLLMALFGFFMRFGFERFINRTDTIPFEPEEEATDLWRRLPLFDAHSDALLLNRNLRRKKSVGHVDFPRLREGRVTLAVFAVATHVPFGVNHTLNRRRTPDALSLIYAAQGSPLALRSPFGRAIIQSKRLQQMLTHSGYELVTQARQLMPPADAAVRPRGILLGLEGAHALPSVADLDTLFLTYHYRILGLAHFIDNRYAGSAHGEQKHGLTADGLHLIERCRELGMVVDLAHASEQTILDVCRVTTRPLFCSHTGIMHHFVSARNISAAAARAIANVGGVCGVGFWQDAIGGNTPDHIADALVSYIDLIGLDHVCLGSDFDGGIHTTFDVSDMGKLIIDALLKRGLSEDAIEQIMWHNGVRVLRAILPEQ